MNPDQLEKDKQLQFHCRAVAVARTDALITEALGMVKGWSPAMVVLWTHQNNKLIELMRATRQLLPF